MAKTPYAETEALVAMMAGEGESVDAILADMLDGELENLLGVLADLDDHVRFILSDRKRADRVRDGWRIK